MRRQRKKQGRPRELSAFTSPVRFCFFRCVIGSVVVNDNRTCIKELPAEDFAGSQVGLEFDGMRAPTYLFLLMAIQAANQFGRRLSATGMMAAGTLRCVLDRWSIGALGLLGLLLSRTGVIRRTRTIERTTRHGIKWRTCTFHTGSIFSTAISKHRTNVRVQNDGHNTNGNNTFLHSGIPYRLFTPACASIEKFQNVLRVQG